MPSARRSSAKVLGADVGGTDDEALGLVDELGVEGGGVGSCCCWCSALSAGEIMLAMLGDEEGDVALGLVVDDKMGELELGDDDKVSAPVLSLA